MESPCFISHAPFWSKEMAVVVYSATFSTQDEGEMVHFNITHLHM